MKYVLALDVGTTTVRCHVIDQGANTICSVAQKVELLYPKPGYVEIDPDHLWMLIEDVMRRAVVESNVDPKAIVSMGISTQRATFTTWSLTTGKYYHRFVTWKDLRADSLVNEWNNSLTMRGVRIGSNILYTLLRNKRFLAGSVFKFMNTQITLRLVWVLQNVAGLREAAIKGEAVFGGVDSWIMYKLTGKHITDVSNASATGLFDPFEMQWASWAQTLLKLPPSMFPEVVDTARDFGVTPKNILGEEIPITCLMADQAASLYGSGCFQPGDLKVTMGTGSFINVNTGNGPHASVTGLYPLVAWRMDNELTYVVEGSSNDTGTFIEWAKYAGVIKNEAETIDLVNSVDDSDGVYFVPAFSGLQAPINDHCAATGILGVKPTTKNAHIVRSLLESLVFKVILLYESICSETSFSYHKIRVDGGVSKNDFIIQLLADLTGLEVERAVSTEMSIAGVGFIAGLQTGVWECKEDLIKFRKIDQTFKPNNEVRLGYEPVYSEWKRAIKRFGKWY
ncbi:putative glycerol kinase 5 [Prorops nasuta]|uniref:putative glycerol kinase 5 n=1 Tax=Prorops nasuta TaxID=863751 RepID=UPI0034CD7F83